MNRYGVMFPPYETWEFMPWDRMRMPAGIGAIWFRTVTPLVQHGIRELSMGASVEHTLRQVATSAVLVGMGLDPMTALNVVEQWEHAMLYRRPFMGC